MSTKNSSLALKAYYYLSEYNWAFLMAGMKRPAAVTPAKNWIMFMGMLISAATGLYMKDSTRKYPITMHIPAAPIPIIAFKLKKLLPSRFEIKYAREKALLIKPPDQ